eukprot:TRINITY_DN2382_c0_g1_i18.p1 TRINITY_DN2382_c0_g1~~TRINITY_DN2382_c0_g1_i18.p1  ORF type:complete len:737 (+),score=75.93 TRINITY_DN2382_c0_g1_i18:507-2717(+)
MSPQQSPTSSYCSSGLIAAAGAVGGGGGRGSRNTSSKDTVGVQSPFSSLRPTSPSSMKLPHISLPTGASDTNNNNSNHPSNNHAANNNYNNTTGGSIAKLSDSKLRSAAAAIIRTAIRGMMDSTDIKVGPLGQCIYMLCCKLSGSRQWEPIPKNSVSSHHSGELFNGAGSGSLDDILPDSVMNIPTQSFPTPALSATSSSRVPRGYSSASTTSSLLSMLVAVSFLRYYDDDKKVADTLPLSDPPTSLMIADSAVGLAKWVESIDEETFTAMMNAVEQHVLDTCSVSLRPHPMQHSSPRGGGKNGNISMKALSWISQPSNATVAIFEAVVGILKLHREDLSSSVTTIIQPLTQLLVKANYGFEAVSKLFLIVLRAMLYPKKFMTKPKTSTTNDDVNTTIDSTVSVVVIPLGAPPSVLSRVVATILRTIHDSVYSGVPFVTKSITTPTTKKSSNSRVSESEAASLATTAEVAISSLPNALISQASYSLGTHLASRPVLLQPIVVKPFPAAELRLFSVLWNLSAPVFPQAMQIIAKRFIVSNTQPDAAATAAAAITKSSKLLAASKHHKREVDNSSSGGATGELSHGPPEHIIVSTARHLGHLFNKMVVTLEELRQESTEQQKNNSSGGGRVQSTAALSPYRIALEAAAASWAAEVLPFPHVPKTTTEGSRKLETHRQPPIELNKLETCANALSSALQDSNVSTFVFPVFEQYLPPVDQNQSHHQQHRTEVPLLSLIHI